MQLFSRFIGTAVAVAASVLLASCGGSSSPVAPKASVSRVIVAGDSIADVGTFGFKFTVQNSADPAGFPIWTQLVTNAYGVNGSAQCNFFKFTGTTFVPNSTAGCTNYAVGGGRIVNQASNGGAAAPFDIRTQLATIAATNGGYTANDLVLIDGGGNDAADTVGLYLSAGTPAGSAAYMTFLRQQLSDATIASILAKPNGTNEVTAAYLVALADTFYAAIKSQVLDKGATRVAVLNMPDITLTPRFQAVLAGIAASAGAAQATAGQAVIRGWISGFNTKLKANFAGDARVALVDFYADFTDQVANPAAYSLTNAKDTACPVTGVGSDGLPTYTFPTCTSAALDAKPPAGMGAGWYNQYAFSDGFHPTPYGHKLLSAGVSRALARAGFL